MRIICVHNDDGAISIYVPPALAEEFKLMVHKGTNCAPNQSHYIRDFHDKLRQQEHIMGKNMKEDIYKDMTDPMRQVEIIRTPSDEIQRVIETTKRIEVDYNIHPNYKL